MYPRLPHRKARTHIAVAQASPMAEDGVAYPGWYLVHWHYLPGGYLSQRSVALYDQLIRRIYYAGQEGRVTNRLARMLTHQFPDGRFLEIGCGPGHLLTALDDAGSSTELTGVDLSPYQLERAINETSTSLSPARLVHADASALPFEAASFDAAIACHVLGHVPVAVRAAMLAELHRVVRPGGRLLLFEHNWHTIAGGPWKRRGSSAIRGTFGRIITLEHSR